MHIDIQFHFIMEILDGNNILQKKLSLLDNPVDMLTIKS